jgi:hypothetical protein
MQQQGRRDNRAHEPCRSHRRNQQSLIDGARRETGHEHERQPNAEVKSNGVDTRSAAGIRARRQPGQQQRANCCYGHGAGTAETSPAGSPHGSQTQSGSRSTTSARS